MVASLPLFLRTVPVWLAAFFSPTVYFFLFLFANSLRVAPNLPAAFYVTLFFLILAGALLFCVGVLWTTKMSLARKIGLTVFTSLGLLLQFGTILVILRAILITITAYPQ
ncbi:hypothetical protein ACXR0O_15540 [Verrucomicrobiota bacterium sgz303538]